MRHARVCASARSCADAPHGRAAIDADLFALRDANAGTSDAIDRHMRNFNLGLLSSLSLVIGCAHDAPKPTVPPAPAFEETATPTRPDSAASEGVAAIAPEDQVFFAFDSVTLDRSMQSILDDVAVWVRADPARTLLVQGHADRAGAASYNLDLSTRRAQAVADYLRERGVPSIQVIVVAKGEDSASLVPGRANRRVVIFATAQEPTPTPG